MIIDCSLDWSEISLATGSYIRPGGIALTQRALDICKLPVGSRLVDIGCGIGGTLDYLGQNGAYHLTGLDPSESLLGQVEGGQSHGRLIRGTGDTLPFKDSSFDALLCECVLSVLNNKQLALSEFARVLDQDGYLIISDVFIKEGSGQQRSEETQGGRPARDGLLTRENLWTLLRGFGFSPLLWEEHDGLLKEFLARMIMAGERLPDSWRCRGGRGDRETGLPKISYFLLVARKGNSFPAQ
jgi:arsenite methyltransferase